MTCNDVKKDNGKGTGPCVGSAKLSRKLAKKRQHIEVITENDETSFLADKNTADDVKTEIVKDEPEVKSEQVTDKCSGWEPQLWREQLQNVNEMRRERNAPVDTMGCDVISDEKALPHVSVIHSM